MQILGQMLAQDIKILMEKYRNRTFLNNSDVAEILDISPACLRKRCESDDNPYKGLYEKDGLRNKWNKYHFFKWYFSKIVSSIGFEFDINQIL